MPSRTTSLAIHGGTPVRGPHKKWPAWPIFDDAERKAVSQVLDSGKWWYGERVAQFEQEFAAFQDAGHCVTCTSGTTALEVCLEALKIGIGDEVIVPPYTFIATVSAVVRVGAHPVFVDVDESWCLNPDLIEAAVTPRTKAVMPVHFGGRIADMDRINAIAEQHNLAVIEDACHSWGAKWKGKGSGALGRCGVFSFQMSKNITSGEGGAIVTDEETLADRCRSITNCGRAKGSEWYGHALFGTNARLTEFQAAILSAQLSRLEAQTRLRERNGAFLNQTLAQIEGLVPQPGDSRITRRAYHLYCLRVDPERFGCTRDLLVRAAQAEGLPLSTGYGCPLYRQPAFAQLKTGPDYTKCRCPMAEDLCETSGMWLTHPHLLGTEEDMADITRILYKIKDHVHTLTA